MRTRILLGLTALALVHLVATRPFPGTTKTEVVVPPRSAVPTVDEPAHPMFDGIASTEEGLALVWLTPVEVALPQLDS